jgi:hypothetical protein
MPLARRAKVGKVTDFAALSVTEAIEGTLARATDSEAPELICEPGGLDPPRAPYLGHSSTMTTRRYAQQTPEALGERAARALERAGLVGVDSPTLTDVPTLIPCLAGLRLHRLECESDRSARTAPPV